MCCSLTLSRVNVADDVLCYMHVCGHSCGLCTTLSIFVASSLVWFVMVNLKITDGLRGNLEEKSVILPATTTVVSHAARGRGV
jgi:hypothetical protein